MKNFYLLKCNSLLKKMVFVAICIYFIDRLFFDIIPINLFSILIITFFDWIGILFLILFFLVGR